MVAIEGRAVQHLKAEILPVQREWGTHFGLRDAQHEALQLELDSPKAGMLHMLWDCQDAALTRIKLSAFLRKVLRPPENPCSHLYWCVFFFL